MIFRVAKVIDITTRTTIVSNVQLDDHTRIWLLEEEGFKPSPEIWKCRCQNNIFGQSIPDPRSRNVEVRLLTVDSRNIGTSGPLELADRCAHWLTNYWYRLIPKNLFASLRAQLCHFRGMFFCCTLCSILYNTDICCGNFSTQRPLGTYAWFLWATSLQNDCHISLWSH